MANVLRLSAFPAPGASCGGNPAGVVLDAAGMDEAEMLRTAAEVGYSETAFVLGVHGSADRHHSRRVQIRYFSPVSEVPFCGHATIATAVVLADRDGAGVMVFDTAVGEVSIETHKASAGATTASFTSVEPAVYAMGDDVLARLLRLLALRHADLDPKYPPRLSYAGNLHPIVTVGDRATFDGFGFDPERVHELIDAEGWTATITVLHSLSATEWLARNLFPVGDVTEDPATGAAAAATGAYLREIGMLTPPANIRIWQGSHVGRPSLIEAVVPASGGIIVSGTATILR